MSALCSFHETIHRAVSLLLAALILNLAPHVALAQTRVDIRFPSGASSTTVNGTVRGNEYIDYVLNARGGQTMVVSLAVTGTNGNGTAYFNILPAGQDYGGPYVGSNDDDRRAEITIPYDGDWAIRVYLMGNDRDTGKTVGYSMDVYIAPGGNTGSGGSGQSGALLPEEDFFVVSLSTAGGVLNVRNAPRPSGALLGSLPNGTVVRNAGGCTISDGQQWCKVQPSQGGVLGWVAARFLALPGPGGSSNAKPPAPSGNAGMVTVRGVPSNDVLNVRSGPGTSNRIIGALANGDRVRRLRCQEVGGASWCEIEMQTDMRERGWVNARFLGGGSAATQLPSGSRMERITFRGGTSGTEFTDQLGPGMSVTYVLNARNGQFLSFELMAPGRVTYRIFNPDGSTLLDEVPAGQVYSGQLWQSGDHKIEVVNRASSLQSYTVLMSIR